MAVCPAPPADKKAKLEKSTADFSLEAGLDTKVDTKPKKDEVRPTGNEVAKNSLLCHCSPIS